MSSNRPTEPQREADNEYRLRRVTMDVCDGCLFGLGPSCNTPGCTFIRRSVEDGFPMDLDAMTFTKREDVAGLAVGDVVRVSKKAKRRYWGMVGIVERIDAQFPSDPYFVRFRAPDNIPTMFDRASLELVRHAR